MLSGGKAILKQFDLAIDTIDAWVKEGETVLKERKREEIQIFLTRITLTLYRETLDMAAVLKH